MLLMFNKYWKKFKWESFLPIKYANRSQVIVEIKVIKNRINNSLKLLVIAHANIIKNIAPKGIHNWLKKGIINKNRKTFDSKNVKMILISIFMFLKRYY
jgi:hypothetical protein